MVAASGAGGVTLRHARRAVRGKSMFGVRHARCGKSFDGFHVSASSAIALSAGPELRQRDRRAEPKRRAAPPPPRGAAADHRRAWRRPALLSAILLPCCAISAACARTALSILAMRGLTAERSGAGAALVARRLLDVVDGQSKLFRLRTHRGEFAAQGGKRFLQGFHPRGGSGIGDGAAGLPVLDPAPAMRARTGRQSRRIRLRRGGEAG